MKDLIKKKLIVLLLPVLAAGSCHKLYRGPGTGTGHDQALTVKYSHDQGIEHDPDVLYVETFEDSLSQIESRYTDVLNPEGMSLDTDIPQGSRGKHSLKITNVGDDASPAGVSHFIKYDHLVIARKYIGLLKD